MSAASGPARRAVAVASLTQLVVVIDAAVLTIALPSLAKDLHVPLASLPWAANSYSIALAACLLIGGRIADLFGAVPSLRIGLTIFAVASLGAGLAPNFAWLLVFRVLQGIGASLLPPASLALLTDATHPGAERERAVATWTVTATVGGVLAALLGGTLTQLLDWRWTLLINVVIAPILLVLTRGVGRRRAVTEERLRRAHFDVSGTLLLMAGMTGITLAVTGSVADSLRIVAGAAAIIAITAFVVFERWSEHPILPLRLLLTRRVGFTNGAAFLLMAGLAVIGFYSSLYAQLVSGLSPILAALLLLPSALAGIAASRRVPWLIARFGERTVRFAAPLLAAAALVALAVACWFAPPFIALVPILIVQSIGASVSVIVLTSASTRSLPAHRSGLAGALITTAGQIGSAIGLAVFAGAAAAFVGGAQSRVSAVGTTSIAQQASVAAALSVLATVGAAILARAIPPGHATAHPTS